MTLHAFTDGASRGNPGESGIGILVKADNGETVLSLHGYIGKATNNVAEYTALIALLKRARALGCNRLIAHSDSELMVRQVNGDYKVKDENLKKQFRRASKLIEALPFTFELKYVPREGNSEADRLANRGIESRKKIRI
jgi:ribonuclease HI